MIQSFAEILKSEMQNKNFSERELHDQSAVPLPIIRGLLTGQYSPDEKTFKRICHGLPRMRHLYTYRDPTLSPKIQPIIPKTAPLSAKLGEIVRKHDVNLSVLHPEIVSSQTPDVISTPIDVPTVTSVVEETSNLEASSDLIEFMNTKERERFRSCHDAIIYLATHGQYKRSDIFPDSTGKEWQLLFLTRLSESGYVLKVGGTRTLMRFAGVIPKLDLLANDQKKLAQLVFPGRFGSFSDHMPIQESTNQEISEESIGVPAIEDPIPDSVSESPVLNPEITLQDIFDYVSAGGGIPKFLEVLTWQHQRITTLETQSREMLQKLEATNRTLISISNFLSASFLRVQK